MSVPRKAGNGRFDSNLFMPIEVDLNFIVDSANGNGLGIRSLKSNGWVQSVRMNSQLGPAGSPALGSARQYAVLGASAVTSSDGSAGTILTGNLGIFPGTSITGFPPATASGSVNVANVAAQSAQASANAAYIAMQAQTPATIATELGGQSLTPGTYKAASGTFTLNSPLTLTGNGVYVFQTTTTLITGGTGVPSFILAGGASAANIYFVVGSSATLNSSNGGTFQGNVIALTSITVTDAGTVNGSLIALNGAVTLTAAIVVNSQSLSSSGLNPAPGFALIQFKNNFQQYIGGFSGFVSPVSGSPLTSTTAGQAYIIVSLGSASLAQWQAAGVPQGLVPSIGMSFIALASGSIGGSAAVEIPSSSGISSVEIVGDPNQSLNNSNIASNNGAYVLVQFMTAGVLNAPKDQSVCGMTFKFEQSSVSVDGL